MYGHNGPRCCWIRKIDVSRENKSVRVLFYTEAQYEALNPVEDFDSQCASFVTYPEEAKGFAPFGQYPPFYVDEMRGGCLCEMTETG